MVGSLGSLALAAAALRRMEQMGDKWEGDMPDPRKVQTCNLSEEEIAERDRPKSRQERRQVERLRKKGRAQ